MIFFNKSKQQPKGGLFLIKLAYIHWECIGNLSTLLLLFSILSTPVVTRCARESNRVWSRQKSLHPHGVYALAQMTDKENKSHSSSYAEK